MFFSFSNFLLPSILFTELMTALDASDEDYAASIGCRLAPVPVLAERTMDSGKEGEWRDI